MTSGLQRLQALELVWDISHVDEDTACLMRTEDNPEMAAEELAQRTLQRIHAVFGEARTNEAESVSDDALKERLGKLRKRIVAEPGKYAPRGYFSMKDTCAMLGLKPRTIFNWLKLIRENDEDAAFKVLVDKRTLVDHKGPATDPKALTVEERSRICELAQRPEFEGLSIDKRYHKLLDDGDLPFLCSKRTFYRVLEQEGILAKLKVTKPKRKGRSSANNKREAHYARDVNKVWSYDITYLFGPNGEQYYGIAIMDLYSRYVLHSDVFDEQTEANVSQFLAKAFEDYKIMPKQLVVHTDNGSQMRSALTTAVLAAFGVTESHSRPHVSNDNSHIERLWNTAKHSSYGLESTSFSSLDEAKRSFATAMLNYNHIPHSSLKHITPYDRYHGSEKTVLAARQSKVEAYKAAHPERWGNRPMQDFTPVGEQILNPHFLKEEVANKVAQG